MKREAPNTIVQDGKKGIRGLMSVFMEIQGVTGFAGEIGCGGIGEFGASLRDKETLKMGVSGLFRQRKRWSK